VGLISQHQLSTFSSPVNGTSPIDANTVRGNDNTVKTAYNAHDADTTIHLQNGLVASRPAASTAGQMWLASDAGAVYAYLDTGSAWVEVNYLRSTGGTVSGPVTVSDTTDSSSSTTGALIVSGGVGIAKKLYVGTGLTVVSGTSALQAVTATSLTVSAGGINSTGNVIFGADNAYDIGANGSNRPRNVYVAGNIVTGGNVGIGVAPTYTLHVVKAAASDLIAAFTNSSATTPYGIAVNLSGAAPNDAVRYFANFADSVGNKFTFQSNGGLYNFSANNANLSDERTKHMGALIEGRYAADTFAKLAPAWQRFQYKDQTHTDDNIGTGAHALYDLLPLDIRDSIVNTTDGWGEKDTLKLWTIYETDLNYLSHAAVSNLAQRVAALEAGAR
jgi:hypothetical protein